jgi:hypothetical protein
MKPQVETQAFSSAEKADPYTQLISAIQNDRASTISVPVLSEMLGVKSTTLNARFRRKRITLRTLGRTSFIPRELALNLAEIQKYSLIGWPTLQQASRLTGIKPGTIKARCEKGQLEGYVDLTKRLRINPVELKNLEVRGASGHDRPADKQPQAQLDIGTLRNEKGNESPRPVRPRIRATFQPKKRSSGTLIKRGTEQVPLESSRFVLPPAPEPKIKIITGKDYGLLEIASRPEDRVNSPKAGQRKKGRSGCLSYEPERPFSVSECAVGQSIAYGQHCGTILKVIDDPFGPKIQVKFPEHEHPLMKEVLLAVGKRRTHETDF